MIDFLEALCLNVRFIFRERKEKKRVREERLDREGSKKVNLVGRGRKRTMEGPYKQYRKTIANHDMWMVARGSHGQDYSWP